MLPGRPGLRTIFTVVPDDRFAAHRISLPSGTMSACCAPLRVLNQKGGVGKTTVTLGLASAAAAAGRRVLVVDLDPQASSTWVLGIDPDTLNAIGSRQIRPANTSPEQIMRLRLVAITSTCCPPTSTLQELETGDAERTPERRSPQVARRVRGDPDRLPAVAGQPHPQRTHRGPPRAGRGRAVRTRPARHRRRRRHDRRRVGHHQSRARAVGRDPQPRSGHLVAKPIAVSPNWR